MELDKGKLRRAGQHGGMDPPACVTLAPKMELLKPPRRSTRRLVPVCCLVSTFRHRTPTVIVECMPVAVDRCCSCSNVELVRSWLAPLPTNSFYHCAELNTESLFHRFVYSCYFVRRICNF